MVSKTDVNPGPNYIKPEEFGRDSRSVDYTPDKSAATLITGLGDMVTKGIELTDKLYKDKIEADIYKATDPISDAWQQTLDGVRDEQTAAGAKGVNPLDANAQATDEDLLPGEEDEAPAGVEAGVDRVSTVAAGAKAPKATPTLYYAKMVAEQKRIRNMYPSYRAYVDAKFQQATGRDNANALASSTLRDINTAASSQAATNSALIKRVQAMNIKGYKNAPYVLAEVMAKGATPEMTLKVEQWIYNNVEPERRLSVANTALNLREANIKNDSITAEDAAVSYIMSVGANSLNNQNILEGIATGKTPLQLAQEMSSGKMQPDGKVIESVTSALAADKVRVAKETFDKLSERGVNGRSIVRILGPDRVKALIAEGGAIHDQTIDLFQNKNYGLAYLHERLAKGIVDKERFTMYTDKYAKLNIMIKLAAENPVLSQQLSKEIFSSGVINDYVGYYGTSRLQALTQPQREAGKIFTLKENLEDAQGVVKDPKVFGKLLDTSKYITDPTMGANDSDKRNVFSYLFDQKNLGNMALIPADTVDPTTGRPISGRYSLFQKYGSKEMAREAIRLGGQTEQDYRRYMTTTFADELFPQHIGQIKNVLAANSRGDETMGKIDWEPKEGRFVILPPKSMPNSAARMAYSAAARAVGQLNGGLQTLRNVDEASGKKNDPTGMVNALVERLRANQPEDANPINTYLSGVLQKAVEKGKANVKSNTPSSLGGTRALPFAEEHTSDLNQWIANPAGVMGQTPPIVAKSKPGKDRAAIGTGEILHVDTKEIPEGMSGDEYLRWLRNNGN